MAESESTMAQQVAQAVSTFQRQSTGHMPKAVTVVLSGDTLVVTLHEALSPAEKALAKTPAGAAQVQEFHRQLFADASSSLRHEIKRITGVEVREAAAEIETSTGTMVLAFATGTMVPVFCSPGTYLQKPGMGMHRAERRFPPRSICDQRKPRTPCPPEDLHRRPPSKPWRPRPAASLVLQTVERTFPWV